MSPREAANDYARRFAEMSANRDQDALLIALEIKALVQLRIQTRGYNFEETPFVPYTSQYAKRRKKEGYQVEYVDFTKTGRLWANVRPEVTQSTPTFTRVEITARDNRSQSKLQGAARKRGNILLISSKEEEILRRLNQDRINRYFQ